MTEVKYVNIKWCLICFPFYCNYNSTISLGGDLDAIISKIKKKLKHIVFFSVTQLALAALAAFTKAANKSLTTCCIAALVEYTSVEFRAVNYILFFVFLFLFSSIVVTAIIIALIRTHKKQVSHQYP